MGVLGLITEYNPFHNGHLHHLQAARSLTAPEVTVAVMSGSFLQRGTPALLDKWTRARMALDAGIDLVVELPALYACASAEHFARGSVWLLQCLGATDLCFGSETGGLEPLRAMAGILSSESPEFRERLKSDLARGISYPSAREAAMQAAAGEAQLQLGSPNDILGVEYLRALQHLNVPITPHTIPRKQAGYHSTALEGGICSATAIREALAGGGTAEALSGFMPEEAWLRMKEQLDCGRAVLDDAYGPILSYKLRMSSDQDWPAYADADEGLWQRLRRAAARSTETEGILKEAKTKRYTRTRIQRVLAAVLLEMPPDARGRLGLPRYLRILGMNETGQAHVAGLKKRTPVPIITNLSRFRSEDTLLLEMLTYDLRATDLQAMGFRNPESRSSGADWRVRGPIRSHR